MEPQAVCEAIHQAISGAPTSDPRLRYWLWVAVAHRVSLCLCQTVLTPALSLPAVHNLQPKMERRTFLGTLLGILSCGHSSAAQAVTAGSAMPVTLLGISLQGGIVYELLKTKERWLDSERFQLQGRILVTAGERSNRLYGQAGLVPSNLFRPIHNLAWLKDEFPKSTACIVLSYFECPVAQRTLADLLLAAREHFPLVISIGLRTSKNAAVPRGIRDSRNIGVELASRAAETSADVSITVSDRAGREPLSRLASQYGSVRAIPLTPELEQALRDASRAGKDALAAPVLRALGKPQYQAFRLSQLVEQACRGT